MADQIEGDTVKAGDKVTATVTESGHTPEKKDFITGMAVGIVSYILKQFEIQTGIPIWAPIEVAIQTVAVGLISYFSQERLRTGNAPTLKDVVATVTALVVTSAIKGYEQTGTDVPAEYESAITAFVVGLVSGYVPTKNITVNVRGAARATA